MTSQRIPHTTNQESLMTNVFTENHSTPDLLTSLDAPDAESARGGLRVAAAKARRDGHQIARLAAFIATIDGRVHARLATRGVWRRLLRGQEGAARLDELNGPGEPDVLRVVDLDKPGGTSFVLGVPVNIGGAYPPGVSVRGPR